MFPRSLTTGAVIPDGSGNVCDGREPRNSSLFYKGILKKWGNDVIAVEIFICTPPFDFARDVGYNICQSRRKPFSL